VANQTSSPPHIALPEGELADALAATPADGGHHRAFVRLRGRTVVFHSVRTEEPEERWLGYSAAAAKRASIKSGRLLPLVASGQSEGCFYVAYEIGSAIPLAAYREVVQLSTEQAVQILWGIAAGLDDAVGHKLFPAEVTPESIFIDPSRGALLGDLGVAREALGNPPAARDAQAAWVAPEVLRGGSAEERSATYSFGALMYTLFAGAPPHEGTPGEIASAAPPRLKKLRPDLPPGLDLIVAAAMSPDPRRRYHSAGEARRLISLVAGGSLATPPVEIEKPPPQRPRPAPRFERPAKPAAAAAKSAEETVERPAKPPPPPAKRARKERPPRPPKERAPRARKEPPPRARKEAPPRPRKERPPRARKEPPPRPSEETADVEPALVLSPLPTRAARNAALLAVGVALVLGTVAGLALGGGSDSRSTPRERAAQGGFAVDLPEGWRQTHVDAAALTAGPAGDPGSGLSVQEVSSPVEGAERVDPVRLGKLQAWRDPEADVPGARAAVRYVAPTIAGKLVITCRAGAGASAGVLQQCERSASTLRLPSVNVVPLESVLAEEEELRVAAARLSQQRTAIRRRLARAGRPAEQRLAADALARVYTHAAERFAEVAAGAAAAGAARAVAVAYEELGAAAEEREAERWNAARADVRRAEAALARALAAD
jgi:serine/threonine protein kinase